VKPATTTIKKDLFIMCQAGSGTVIYETGAMDDDGKPLQLCYVADEGDQYWHLFQSGSKIHAVSSISDGILEFSLNRDCAYIKQHVRQPTADPFVMVTRVGRETIALTDTLQVFHQTQFNYGRSTAWLRYTADESDVVGRRVVMAGYVVVNDDSFVVCDAVTRSCLLFDLGAKRWRVVMPWAAFEGLPTDIRANGVLNGRCVFVDGFIYTCRNGGLAAYELLGEDSSVYLSKPIFLPFTWHPDCLGQDMCLDYAGKDLDSGANMLHVVQGESLSDHLDYTCMVLIIFPSNVVIICVYMLLGGSSLPKHKHGVQITTVKVRTQRTVSNRMKPTRIDHSATLFVPHAEAIAVRCCIAVS
jgi:hypothetical protein